MTAVERYDICKDCEFFWSYFKQCKLCKCFMPLKVKLKSPKCPLRKWD